MKTQIRAGRNGKVEFWRFIFSLIIVIHHSRYLVGDENCKFLGGSLAVEFFFLISGYLMMASINRRNDEPGMLGKETLLFLWKKVKSLFPELLVAHVIALGFEAYAKDYSLYQTVRLGVDSFFELTLVKMSGIYSVSLNGVTWYISTMLICMAVLYPLIRKFPDMMTKIVAPLTALLLLGYLSGNYTEPRNPLKWIGFTYKGNIRGMAEICLGVVCYQICDKLKQLRLTTLGKVVVAAGEWLCYLVAIWYMYTQKATEYDFFVILILMAAVTLTFSHQGVDAGIFDRKLFKQLGKYSVLLFLSHTFYAQNLKAVLPAGWTDGRKMLVYLVLTVITAAVVGAVSALLRKLTPKMAELGKRLFLKDTR